MKNANKKKAGWKQKAVHEMMEYSINFIYLAGFFSLFTWYRRLVLSEYQVIYLNYWFSVVEALVLAKVIMIGDILGLGRRLQLQEKPLIFPTLYKTVVFSVWAGLFHVLEHTIGGLLRGKGLSGGFDELMSRGRYELLSNFMVVFFAFIPFFAVKELGRVLGEGKIREMFFLRGAATKSNLPTGSTPHHSA
jgi:hypothetical protein